MGGDEGEIVEAKMGTVGAIKHDDVIRCYGGGYLG